MNCPGTHRIPLDQTKYQTKWDFINQYKLDIQFDIECLGCCFGYLMTDRNYNEVVGPINHVHFSDENAPKEFCFVKVPGGSGRFGQISTNTALNLGPSYKRVVEQSRTYMLYGEPTNVVMGRVLMARMESLAIDEATSMELSSVWVTYADAALIELYRDSRHNPLPSLNGFCNVPNEPTVAWLAN